MSNSVATKRTQSTSEFETTSTLDELESSARDLTEIQYEFLYESLGKRLRAIIRRRAVGLIGACCYSMDDLDSLAQEVIADLFDELAGYRGEQGEAVIDFAIRVIEDKIASLAEERLSVLRLISAIPSARSFRRPAVHSLRYDFSRSRGRAKISSTPRGWAPRPCCRVTRTHHLFFGDRLASMEETSDRNSPAFCPT